MHADSHVNLDNHNTLPECASTGSPTCKSTTPDGLSNMMHADSVICKTVKYTADSDSDSDSDSVSILLDASTTYKPINLEHSLNSLRKSQLQEPTNTENREHPVLFHLVI